MLTTRDKKLRKNFYKSEKKKNINSYLLVSLPLAFIVFTFVLPIGSILVRSVDNPRMTELLPNLIDDLLKWDGKDLPSEETYEKLFNDLQLNIKNGTIGKIAIHMNYSMVGARSMIVKSKRKFKNIKGPPYKEQIIKSDKRWGELETWKIMQQVSKPFTTMHFLNAIDKKYDIENNIINQPEEKQIYIKLFIRTLWVSFLVTFLTFMLGYPIAYLLSITSTKVSNLLMVLVLLPFWTSLLVRTTSWIVLLQTQGVINDILVWMHIISDDNRIQLIYNLTGVLISMTQILLPFMILPMYSVMKQIPDSQVRASKSLGATPFRTFFKIFYPQSLSGIGAGSLLVFVLSIGYYITPALIGGSAGQMISNQIAFHMQHSLNWGLAAALGSITLISVLVMYWVYDHIFGIEKIKLG